MNTHYKASSGSKDRARRWKALCPQFLQYTQANPQMTWVDLSKRMGVDSQCITKWISGLGNPSHTSMDQVERLLRGEL